MKNFIKTVAAILIAALFFVAGGREKVIEVFGGNVGLDGFYRAVEVAVAKNPAAAFVFSMESGDMADEC